MIGFRLLRVFFLFLCLHGLAQEGANMVLIPPGATGEAVLNLAARLAPSGRQMAWQELEYMAFCHFSINTFTDKEWGDGTEDPALFNPVAFDARQWMKVFKEAGIRQVILTAKHHDGFCLWPSRYTAHSVASSPWKEGKGDIVKEVSDACREYGLEFGVYLSPWDRHEKTYGDTPAYNRYFLNQLGELLTGYGEVSEVWFDGACAEGPNGKKQEYDWPSYYKLVRKLQPEAVIAVMGPDARWVGTESGYGRITEWSVVPVEIPDSLPRHYPPSAADSMLFFIPGDRMDTDLGSRQKLIKARALAWYPSEVDVSIRPGWFYHEREDSLVKSPEKLLDIYFSSIGRNSVLLLNIPPDRRGLLHAEDEASLVGLMDILRKTFSDNLLSGSSVAVKTLKLAGNEGNLVDGDPSTFLEVPGGMSVLEIEYSLQKEITFNVLSLQEYIRMGQRVGSFTLEVFSEGQWKSIAEGTTIGYKRILHFRQTTASRIRLRITAFRASPVLAETGLWLCPVEAP
jgi:alpha-L-fucosidase